MYVEKVIGDHYVPGLTYDIGSGAVYEFTNGFIKDINKPMPQSKSIEETKK